MGDRGCSAVRTPQCVQPGVQHPCRGWVGPTQARVRALVWHAPGGMLAGGARRGAARVPVHSLAYVARPSQCKSSGSAMPAPSSRLSGAWSTSRYGCRQGCVYTTIIYIAGERRWTEADGWAGACRCWHIHGRARKGCPTPGLALRHPATATRVRKAAAAAPGPALLALMRLTMARAAMSSTEKSRSTCRAGCPQACEAERR